MEDKNILAIELEKPHGFLIWKGKQTCLIDKEFLPTNESVAIVSDGELYGFVKLETPVEVDKEFLKETNDHRLKSYEIPNGNLYAHIIESFEPLEKPLPAKVENGLLVLEKLEEISDKEKELLDKAKDLPNSITIAKDVVLIDKENNLKTEVLTDNFINIINKNFGSEFNLINKFDSSACGLYDLTLTRVPNMRFKQIEPLNLRMADNEAISCKNCEYWNNGKCELYNYLTDSNQVCDSFDPKYEGTFISLPIPIDIANYLSLSEDSVPMNSKLVMPEDMHITIYYEKEINPLNLLDLPQLLDYIAEEIQQPKVNINGIAKFEMVEDGEFDALVVGVTSPQIEKIHNWICSYMGIDFEEKRFTPHITLAYVPVGTQIPNINYNRETFSIPNITLNAGGTRMFETKFRGMPYEEMEAKQMPYEIIERDDKYCVRKIGETKPMKCYNTENEAQDYLIALEIATQNEEKQLPEKAKEGRRLKTEWLKKLNDLYTTVSDMLTWAKREDDWKMIGFSIKEIDGEPYFYTFSSNAFEDRDGEIIATDALNEYVLRNDENEIKGYFNFWHIPGTDFAEKRWQALIGRILVEAGPFMKNKNGRQALKFFKKHQKSHPIFAPEGWGASIEFKYLPEQRPSGVYKWLHITRTSVLPLSRAANINTKGELKMTPEQRELGKEIFGEDQFTQIEEYAQNLTKELEKTTRYKEVENENSEVVTENVETQVEQIPVSEENTEEIKVPEDETEEEVTQVEENNVETETIEAETPQVNVEDVVNQVAERVIEGLKEDLSNVNQLINTFPDELHKLNSRLDQLEEKAKVEKAIKPRSWGLFQQNFANSITQEKEGKEATEEDIKNVAPPETKPNEKSDEGYGGVFFNR